METFFIKNGYQEKKEGNVGRISLHGCGFGKQDTYIM